MFDHEELRTLVNGQQIGLVYFDEEVLVAVPTSNEEAAALEGTLYYLKDGRPACVVGSLGRAAVVEYGL